MRPERMGAFRSRKWGLLMIRKEEFEFDSRDGKTRLHAVRWIPEGKVICILQIVHGMAEYVERYEEFARYMAKKGVLVTGEDHLGHGKSVPQGGVYGYFCKQDPATVVVRDVHRLKKMTQEEYPGVPYVILGHSMGSFIFRNYLSRYGTGIQGAIICGTGSMPAPVILSAKAVAKIQKLFVGEKHISKLLDSLAFGSYNKRIKQHETAFDWLAGNKPVVEAYMKDPLCGFVFTVNGFETLFELINRAQKPENMRKIPKELPVFFIAGEEDPVGDYGAGVERVYKSYKEELGIKNVKIKLYAGDRHEILNESDKEQIYEDIYPWLMERVKEYQL